VVEFTLDSNHPNGELLCRHGRWRLINSLLVTSVDEWPSHDENLELVPCYLQSL